MKPRMKLRLSLLAMPLSGALLVCAGWCAEARATVMIRASVEELATESAVVILGEVTATEVVSAGPRAGIFTRVTMAPEERWRGPVTGGDVRFYVHGGRLGDRAMRTHGQATFEVGERVVVFLEDVGDGTLFPTGMSQGKWTVEGDLARSCADVGALVERDATGRLRPSTARLDAISLGALRARVEAAR